MSKFKVGDKVVRSTDSNREIFLWHAGKKDYYTVTGVSSSGMWLQLDYKTREGDNYPWLAPFYELYQEPEDELPPAPASVTYMNSKRDPGNDQRLVLDKDNGDGEGLMYIGVIPKKGSTRAKVEIGINIDPDSALQLAHDIRRMAMDIKRKEKQNA
ncbi:hypothetical protein [Klebsiella phage pKP-M186-2.2]|nr:hypothetical protein [Klebsiella phage pKP-M186-2.2]